MVAFFVTTCPLRVFYPRGIYPRKKAIESLIFRTICAIVIATRHILYGIVVMNLEEFESRYGNLTSRCKISIVCDRCSNPKSIQKYRAKNSIATIGQYVCQSCRTKEAAPFKHFSDAARKRMSEASSYPRSDETKEKMSKAKKDYFKSPEGKALRARLSLLTAQGHARNIYENAKRNGWHESKKAGRVFFGSSYELLFCMKFDDDPNIQTYQTQVYFTWDGRGHCLDFLLTYVDGSKEAVEVKPFGRLNEQKNIQQIYDSGCYAAAEDYMFSVYTEHELNMNCKEIRDKADEYLTKIGSFDLIEYRKERNRIKAKKHYHNVIATDQVTVHCKFCNTDHVVLKKSYDANIERNGDYICEREGGHIAGSRPKPHLIKENPYAKDGKKQCNECKEVKLFEEFSPDKSKRDGYSTRCKACRSTANKKKYHDKKK